MERLGEKEASRIFLVFSDCVGIPRTGNPGEAQCLGVKIMSSLPVVSAG